MLFAISIFLPSNIILDWKIMCLIVKLKMMSIVKRLSFVVFQFSQNWSDTFLMPTLLIQFTIQFILLLFFIKNISTVPNVLGMTQSWFYLHDNFYLTNTILIPFEHFTKIL